MLKRTERRWFSLHRIYCGFFRQNAQSILILMHTENQYFMTEVMVDMYFDAEHIADGFSIKKFSPS